MRRALNVAFALVLTMGVSQVASAQEPASPQDPQRPQDHQQIPEQSPAEQSRESAKQTERGELASVDSEEKKLTVKKADGTEMEFTYNDETEVTGAQQGVAGLATASGSQVVVHYEDEAGTKTASKIEVRSSEMQQRQPGAQPQPQPEPQTRPQPQPQPQR